MTDGEVLYWVINPPWHDLVADYADRNLMSRRDAAAQLSTVRDIDSQTYASMCESVGHQPV